MGIAIILVTWLYLRPVLGWFLWSSILLTIVGSVIFLFGFTFTIYFFSLDLKLLALLEKPLALLQDRMKREKKL